MRGRAAVVDVATGAVRYSIPTGLVEISALAVDNTGETALVFGWEADPRYIIQKNFVVRSFPTTGHSTFTPIYLRTDSIPHIRDLAIDTKARIVAYGGGTARHRLGQGGGLHQWDHARRHSARRHDGLDHDPVRQWRRGDNGLPR